MKLKIGYSPCPNDTFIFDALVNGKTANGNFELEIFTEDVQTLNEWADEERLDITKLSFPALFRNRDKYQLLDAGAALGRGVGPLLVGKKMVDLPELANCSVAIPGRATTANLLLDFAFPEIIKKEPFVFSDIEEAVLSGKVDLGVIIHENRFTYQQKGLHRICDLGQIWEERQGVPIPLGCIAIRKSLGEELKNELEALIRQSLQYAWKQYPAIPEYVKQHAQEMDEKVMRQHIELYVNEFSLSLGEEGARAIQTLEQAWNRQQA